MDRVLKSEVNALITDRILAYHSQLIETGQIQDVELKGPSAIPPFLIAPSRSIRARMTL